MYSLTKIYEAVSSEVGDTKSLASSIEEMKDNLHYLSVIEFVNSLTHALSNLDLAGNNPTLSLNVFHIGQEEISNHIFNIGYSDNNGNFANSDFINSRAKKLSDIAKIVSDLSNNTDIRFVSAYKKELQSSEIEFHLGENVDSNQSILLNALLSEKQKVRLAKDELEVNLHSQPVRQMKGAKL